MIDQRARDMAPPDRGRIGGLLTGTSPSATDRSLGPDGWNCGTVGTSDWTCNCGESLKNVPKPLSHYSHYAKET